MAQINEYQIITDLTFGEVHIQKNSQYNNIAADTVYIYEGIRARLFGSVNKLILKKDSKLFMHGEINGELINEGGRIYLFDSDKT